METIKPAPFKLITYRIPQFSYVDYDDDAVEKILLDFDPEGAYSSKGEFLITFNFKAFPKDQEDSPIVTAQMTALFAFKEPVKLADIPPYFYRNSIAIAFPYLRSFITSLTTLGGIRPMILPIMNLSALESKLKENTTEIDEDASEENAQNDE